MVIRSNPDFLASPEPPPDLKIPASSASVDVSAIDTGARFHIPIKSLLQPSIGGKEHLEGPAFAFLVEHPSGRKVLFDLGLPGDLDSLPPKIRQHLKSPGWKVTGGKDIIPILKENDVRADEIEAIIWSHWHWDHTGEPAHFPPTASLIVGPGFKDAHTPGYPENPDARVNSSAWANRELRELSFPSTAPKVGRFSAIDYFADGSFYLLNTPGHTVGHLCALARTSSSPPTFVYLGGDVCHHPGEFRPTPYLPLPTSFTTSQLTRLRKPIPCPGSLFRDVQPEKNPAKPFYEMTSNFPDNEEEAKWSLEGTKEVDAQGNVLVALAHDESLLDVLGFEGTGMKRLDGWKDRGLREKGMWMFLEDWKVDGVEWAK